jgi:hypothetical protein
MTFCDFYKKCEHGKKCNRALTTEVKVKADKWWGKREDEAPICLFANKPDCFKED